MGIEATVPKLKHAAAPVECQGEAPESTEHK